MNVYRSLNSIPYDIDSIITLGTFDGIHIGHRQIIDDLVRRSRKRSFRSVLITFFPHPQHIVRSRSGTVDILTTLEEKLELLQQTGLDAVFVIEFTGPFAQSTPESFIQQLVEHVGFRECIIGYNHKFGKGRRGDIHRLRELGSIHRFTVDVVDPVMVDQSDVSSTRIRKMLQQGDVHHAIRFLGRPYRISGHVVRGSQLGDRIGFPTANIEIAGEYKLIPDDGVYAVFVNVGDQRYSGMVNIGNRPTVDGDTHSIEVHIHDFNEDIYDRSLSIDFVKRLRSEQRFDSIDALIAQIESDKEQTEKILSKND